MIDKLIEIDQEFFLYLNQLHAEWVDPIMFWISGKKEWVPFYLLIIGFLVWKLRWKSVPLLLGIALSILISDQVTSAFMKPFFGRLRPSHEPLLAGRVHNINGYLGGLHGFASSHAANTFGVAAFLWLSLRHRYPFFIWMFAWAALVSYSRIYLGVHYPGDIIVGAVVGMFAGYLSYRLMRWLDEKFHFRD